MVSQLQYNAAANWVREELFQSKLMRENGLEGQYGGRGGQLGRLEKSFCLFSIFSRGNQVLIKVADKILNNQAFSWLGNICLLKPPQYLPFLQLCCNYDYDAGVDDDDDNYKKNKVKPRRKMNKGFCHLLTGLMHHNGPTRLLAGI